jgi:hypothetical protein
MLGTEPAATVYVCYASREPGSYVRARALSIVFWVNRMGVRAYSARTTTQRSSIRPIAAATGIVDGLAELGS